jgi:hypothetical protein
MKVLLHVSTHPQYRQGVLCFCFAEVHDIKTIIGLPANDVGALKHVAVLSLYKILLIYIDIDVFVNCNWVDTRWQYTFTHKQYVEHHS